MMYRIEYKFQSVKKTPTEDGAEIEQIFHHFATTKPLESETEVKEKLKELEQRGDVIEAWITEGRLVTFETEEH